MSLVERVRPYSCEKIKQNSNADYFLFDGSHCHCQIMKLLSLIVPPINSHIYRSAVLGIIVYTCKQLLCNYRNVALVMKQAETQQCNILFLGIAFVKLTV